MKDSLKRQVAALTDAANRAEGFAAAARDLVRKLLAKPAT